MSAPIQSTGPCPLSRRSDLSTIARPISVIGQEQATLCFPVQLVLAGQFNRDVAHHGREIQQLLAAGVAPDQGRVGEKLRRRDIVTNDGDLTMPAPERGRQVGSDGLQGNVRILLKDRSEGFGTEFGLDGGDVAAEYPAKRRPFDRTDASVQSAPKTGSLPFATNPRRRSRYCTIQMLTLRILRASLLES
ncbi:hypothetical protein HNQ71_002036 [Mesorhizobium sangaii]|uniref:Uncharacterized protein n=1 Tax=Mesorhizobium sangaii TaxID=505389 RepID=A0A841P767_9HYPH|nr:hypothetical protein [Mesorhizobium sangaii]